jgi:hypothetical protein
VETNLIDVGDILMAGIAITFRRVNYQTCVSKLFIFQATVTAMADDATDLAMGTLNELGILQEDLLPYLQRR